ncbi:DNA-binding protein [bacterium]|nr:DNA-binding protein [bacterium]
MEYLGNKELLKLKKVCFLCSRKIAPSAILKCYDWATDMRKKQQCVIMGAHSPIEKDVFDILLKGSQPLILVLARGMKSVWSSEVLDQIKAGRLLVIAPFDKNVKRISKETSKKRNALLVSLSAELVIGYLSTNSDLKTLISESPYIIL